jgi:hypothetical protein
VSWPAQPAPAKAGGRPPTSPLATKAELMQQLAPLATKAELAVLATKDEVARIRLHMATLNAKFDQFAEWTRRHCATREDFAELRGYVRSLPTTWVMVTAIVAGQIGIAGVIGGTLLAAARMFLRT